MRFYLPVSLVSFLWSSIQKYRVQYLGIDYCRCSYCETILTGLHPAQTRRVTNSGQTSLHVYLGVDFSGPSWTTGKNIWDHRCPCCCLASGSCKCLCSKYKDFSSFTNHLFVYDVLKMFCDVCRLKGTGISWYHISNSGAKPTIRQLKGSETSSILF